MRVWVRAAVHSTGHRASQCHPERRCLAGLATPQQLRRLNPGRKFEPRRAHSEVARVFDPAFVRLDACLVGSLWPRAAAESVLRPLLSTAFARGKGKRGPPCGLSKKHGVLRKVSGFPKGRRGTCLGIPRPIFRPDLRNEFPRKNTVAACASSHRGGAPRRNSPERGPSSSGLPKGPSFRAFAAAPGRFQRRWATLESGVQSLSPQRRSGAAARRFSHLLNARSGRSIKKGRRSRGVSEAGNRLRKGPALSASTTCPRRLF
ncbi:hypothetical protein M885DRAFT_503595 [Pelagophyceae sp. CCMP2097]|nr:hypothetical protein M885DRAFT_503595 [Pelagophyceae sp. CCMP2097]